MLLIGFCGLIITWLKTWYIIYIEVLLIIISLNLLRFIVKCLRILNSIIRINITYILARKVIKLVLKCIWVLRNKVFLLILRPLIKLDWLLGTWYKTVSVLI